MKAPRIPAPVAAAAPEPPSKPEGNPPDWRAVSLAAGSGAPVEGSDVAAPNATPASAAESSSKSNPPNLDEPSKQEIAAKQVIREDVPPPVLVTYPSLQQSSSAPGASRVPPNSPAPLPPVENKPASRQASGPATASTDRARLEPSHFEEPTKQHHVATLSAGTSLTVRLEDTLSSEQDQSGRLFRGTLEMPVIANGFVIAEKGSPVLGRLLNARQAHLIHRTSDLRMALTAINTSDGQLVPIQTTPWEEKSDRKGIGHTAKHAMGSAAGVMFTAVSDVGRVATLNMVKRGSDNDRAKPKQNDLILPKGSTLTFNLASAVTITER